MASVAASVGLGNTNVIWSGQLIDPWMKVTDTLLARQPWIRKHFEAVYYRSLSKKPGTPSGYHSGYGLY